MRAVADQKSVPGMKVVVVQRRAFDIRVAPECDLRSGRLVTDLQVEQVYPPDSRALDVALQLKRARTASEVSVLHVGPPTGDAWLREARARGCDQVIRLWDPDLALASEVGEALALARAATVLGFDLVLLGAAGPEAPAARLLEILAADLGLPAVTQVLALDAVDGPRVEVSRRLPGGWVERAELQLPAILGLAGRPGEEVASLPALIAAHAQPVPEWDLARLGLPAARLWQAERILRHGPLHTPRPALRPVPTPDASLPAFQRIEQLLQGTTRRRQGRVSRGSGEQLADEIFETLLAEGWLDHLRPQPPEAGA
jgi:electron transfer flavoprotein beta subunit